MSGNRKNDSSQESSEFAACTQRFKAALVEQEGKDRHTTSLKELQRDGQLLEDAFKAFENALRIVVGYDTTGRCVSTNLWNLGLPRHLEPGHVELANGLKGRFRILSSSQRKMRLKSSLRQEVMIERG
jgi:hypothetical protein